MCSNEFISNFKVWCEDFIYNIMILSLCGGNADKWWEDLKQDLKSIEYLNKFFGREYSYSNIVLTKEMSKIIDDSILEFRTAYNSGKFDNDLEYYV